MILRRWDIAHWSLTRRQLFVIGSALTLLALLLGVGGALFIANMAERTSDRMLGASARAIADALSVENGAVTLDMPAGAFGMLEDNARDNVYYAVRQGRRTLTGYTDFPAAPDRTATAADPAFRYERFLDQRVRVATIARRMPRLSEPVIVQVAETLGERNSLARRMLIGLVLLEAVLVAFAVFLIWPAIRWGLKPIAAVKASLDARPPDRLDFTPLDPAEVPPELAGLVTGFNELLTRLEGSVGRMQRFTADASHQMRTPLAILRAHIEVLKQADSSRNLGQAAALRDIDTATERLQRLLVQLLRLARIESAGGEPVILVDIVEIARTVCQRAAPQAVRAGIDMRFTAPDSLTTTVDGDLLAELLTNLVDNAVRYNRTGTFAAVDVTSDGQRIAIRVTDDGPGIPDDMLEKVRDRFFRLQRDAPLEGTGLGLPIADAICFQIGADLRLTARDAGGLLAEIRLTGVGQRDHGKHRG